MANTRRLAGIGILVAVVGALGYFGYSKVQAAKPSDGTAAADSSAPVPQRPDSTGRAFNAGAAQPVVGAPAIRGELIVWVAAPGEAAPSHEVVVGAEAGGRVARVYPREFEMVRAGDTLIVVDTTEMVFALRQARNSLNRAQTSMRNLLISDSLIPDPVIRRERAEAARMSSGVVEAELALERALLEFSKAATLAPISGRVGNLRVAPAQRVGAGTELMTIVATNPIHIHAQVLQSEVGKVKVGNQARITAGSHPDSVFNGRVVAINPLIETSTRSARVTVALNNPQEMIMPGMTVSVSVQSQTYVNRLLVPKNAILQRSDGRDMVLVYHPNADGAEGRTEWRYVNLGLSNSEFIEILPDSDGSQKLVEPGEIVLIDGHYTIEHDVLVRLVDRVVGGRL